MQKTVFLLAALIAIAAAHPTWQSAPSPYFRGWDAKAIKLILGVNRTAHTSTLKKITHAPQALPTDFDARTQWPGCVGGVLDQGRCGSCWAFGAAASFSDRLCIANKSTSYLRLSELDLTVNDQDDNGCGGGNLDSAFGYIHKHGLVSEQCLPYLKSEGGPMVTCVNTTEPCLPPTFVPTPNPSSKCTNGVNFLGDKHKASSVNSVQGASDMATELVNNGPFEVAFDVYDDFVDYKTGVYIRSSSNMLGGHAVRVIGYGVEGGVDYWLVSNSWTAVWGDQGYFKIRRGTNECGIEDEAAFGTPAL